MKTIAQIADVRNEGSLAKDSSDTGFLHDDQIAVALTLGQQAMMRWVSEDYEETRDYVGADAATLTKKVAYQRAESYFSIGSLVVVLNNQQLARTGLLKSKKAGESEVTFSNTDDAAKFANIWSDQAFAALKAYLGNKILSSDGSQIGFRSKDRKLSISGM